MIKNNQAKIDKLIDEKLATLTTQGNLQQAPGQPGTPTVNPKKTAAISAIKEAIKDTTNGFDAAFFDQFKSLTYYAKDGTKQNDWTNNEDAKADLLYYLSQLVATNEHYFTRGQVAIDKANNEFRKEVQNAVEEINTANRPTNQGFFGEQLDVGIQKITTDGLVRLIPSVRTQTWGLVLLWIAIIMGINAGTIFMYFKEDFR